MCRGAFLIVSTVLLGVCAGAADDATKAEQKTLAGTWIIESATINGKAVAGMKGSEFVFDDNGLSFRPAGGKAEPLEYKLDPTHKIKAIDLSSKNKESSAPCGWASYELTGDSLKLVLGPEGKRPSIFVDAGGYLYTLKRKK